MYLPPLSDDDTRRMEAASAFAAGVMGATTTDPPSWGWHGRTLGHRADHPEHGPCWLRLLSVPADTAGGKLWQGTEKAATAFPTVRKPVLHRIYDWNDKTYAYRAELTGYIDEPILSSNPVLHHELALTDSWFATIRTTLKTIAATPTDRTAVRQEWIDRAVPQFTGQPAPQVEHWECAHGDFHAANLTTKATLLDWEGWGSAPRGYDAALLYAYAQLVPPTADRIRSEFTPLLDGPSGRTALLVVCAELLQSASRGDHPDLTPPLRTLVQDALAVRE